MIWGGEGPGQKREKKSQLNNLEEKKTQLNNLELKKKKFNG